MTLYELTGKYMELLAMAEDPEIDAETLADTMEGIAGEIEDKLDGYAVIINSLKTDAAQIKAEEERLSNMRKALENKQKKMLAVITNMMAVTEKQKIKTAKYSFTLRKNPPSLMIDDPYIENFPEEYIVQPEPIIDKAKIKEDLKAGKDLEGLAHLESSVGVIIR